jgi:hypothetical protein
LSGKRKWCEHGRKEASKEVSREEACGKEIDGKKASGKEVSRTKESSILKIRV